MKAKQNHREQLSNSRTATRLLCIALILLALVCLSISNSAHAQEDAGGPIAFGEIENAFARGVAEERVTVVYFTADWCAVCRKMERVVYADAGVRAAAAPFVWAKIDIDKQPELAAMFGIRGVPSFALLNVNGEILYERSGALNVSSMLELLSEYHDQANAPGAVRGRLSSLGELTQRVGQTTQGEAAAADDVLELVLLLAEPNPVGAQETTQRLIEMGPSVWPGLVEAMGHERLAVRAAAFDLLRRSTEHDLPFDPFLAAEEREPLRASWQAWVAEQRAETTDDQAPQDEASSEVSAPDAGDPPADAADDAAASPTPQPAAE